MPSKLPEGAGKRVPLNMRTTQDLRAKLDEAAEQSGRSLAQEVELRLERSFDLPQIIEMAINRTAKLSTAGLEKALSAVEGNIVQLAGGNDLLLLWGRLAAAIRATEYETGRKIRDDDATRNAAERAVLGAVPDLFRNLPPTYSELKAEAAADPVPEMSAEEIKSLEAGGLAPLGRAHVWEDYRNSRK